MWKGKEKFLLNAKTYEVYEVKKEDLSSILLLHDQSK